MLPTTKHVHTPAIKKRSSQERFHCAASNDTFPYKYVKFNRDKIPILNNCIWSHCDMHSSISFPSPSPSPPFALTHILLHVFIINPKHCCNDDATVDRGKELRGIISMSSCPAPPTTATSALPLLPLLTGCCCSYSCICSTQHQGFYEASGWKKSVLSSYMLHCLTGFENLCAMKCNTIPTSDSICHSSHTYVGGYLLYLNCHPICSS